MEHWALFNGWCLTHGFPPLKSDFADFCDVVYYWLSRNADEAEQAKLDEVLGTPPAGEIAEAPGWSREEQMAAFNAF
jgi:hypothetical protein